MKTVKFEKWPDDRLLYETSADHLDIDLSGEYAPVEEVERILEVLEGIIHNGGFLKVVAENPGSLLELRYNQALLINNQRSKSK